MKENANKIVIAVAAALVVLMLMLVLGSGSCSAGGGGGGGAPIASGSSSSSAFVSASSSAASTVSTASSSAGAESYEELYEETMNRLSEGSAPVGSNVRSVSSAPDVFTASEVYAELSARGFANSVLTASFDGSGDYIGATEIDASSAEKYPSYRMSYSSPNGVEWRVVVNGSKFLAIPVATTTGVRIPKEIIITDSDTVTQHDGARGQYSDFTFEQLAASGVVAEKVGKVDKATLDSYAPDALARM